MAAAGEVQEGWGDALAPEAALEAAVAADAVTLEAPRKAAVAAAGEVQKGWGDALAVVRLEKAAASGHPLQFELHLSSQNSPQLLTQTRRSNYGLMHPRLGNYPKILHQIQCSA